MKSFIAPSSFEAYPKIKTYISSNKKVSFQVLFTGPSIGTVINTDGNVYPLGFHFDGWEPDDFAVSYDKIVLSNW